MTFMEFWTQYFLENDFTFFLVLSQKLDVAGCLLADHTTSFPRPVELYLKKVHTVQFNFESCIREQLL